MAKAKSTETTSATDLTDMQPGRIVRQTHFTHVYPEGASVGFKPVKGEIFVMLYVGTIPKTATNEQIAQKFDEFMRQAGWTYNPPEGTGAQ